MTYKTLAWIIGAAGLWSAVNGILHTVFVLLERKPYERELIRLLVDGNILVFGGLFYILTFFGLRKGEPLFLYAGLATSAFFITYCIIIFKLLPAWVFLAINFAVLLLLVLKLLKIT